MRAKIAVFKALSEETRLRILILLARRELCVCEIESALGLSQSRISRHLTVLRNAGLVRDRRQGTWIFYRLSPARNSFERALRKCLKECFSDDRRVKRDFAALEKVLSGERKNICPPRKEGGKK